MSLLTCQVVTLSTCRGLSLVESNLSNSLTLVKSIRLSACRVICWGVRPLSDDKDNTTPWVKPCQVETRSHLLWCRSHLVWEFAENWGGRKSRMIADSPPIVKPIWCDLHHTLSENCLRVIWVYSPLVFWELTVSRLRIGCLVDSRFIYKSIYRLISMSLCRFIDNSLRVDD